MPELEPAVLLDLWRRMVRIRRFEERVHIETMEKRTEGYTHTAYGEEATAVGVISLLRPDDWFTTTYRNHHHAIARDMPLEARSPASCWAGRPASSSAVAAPCMSPTRTSA